VDSSICPDCLYRHPVWKSLEKDAEIMAALRTREVAFEEALDARTKAQELEAQTDEQGRLVHREVDEDDEHSVHQQHHSPPQYHLHPPTPVQPVRELRRAQMMQALGEAPQSPYSEHSRQLGSNLSSRMPSRSSRRSPMVSIVLPQTAAQQQQQQQSQHDRVFSPDASTSPRPSPPRSILSSPESRSRSRSRRLESMDADGAAAVLTVHFDDSEQHEERIVR
jgi:hypothetical protein